jgi:hypothetical protein
LDATQRASDVVNAVTGDDERSTALGPVKRQGVSGESSNESLLPSGGALSAKIPLPKIEKDFR